MSFHPPPLTALFTLALSFVPFLSFAQAPHQVLLETSGVIPAQNSQFAGGSRQMVDLGPIVVPRSGRLTIVVTSTPNVRQEVENITRFDSMVERITFNGTEVDLRPDYPECNPPGSNPAVCTSVWDPPVGGTLFVRMLGPATYNIFGEFSGHAAQNYTITVDFQPGPDVTEVVPDSGSLGGWETVSVHGNYFEDDSVVLFGGVAATDTMVVSAQQIICRTPPGIPGATDVVVLVPDPIEARWNYGRPWGVFGTLPGGFTYSPAKGKGPAQSTERLLGTYAGFFREQRNVNADPQSHRQSAEFDFVIPGAGRLRWEAWAFIPITSPVLGPPGDEMNFEAFNDSTAVRAFRRGDGMTAAAHVNCTSLTFLYGPVICNSTQIVDATGSGSGDFTVLGPARISALFEDFLSAPFQDWSLALYFADQPVVISVLPGTGSPLGGELVTVSGSEFGEGARVFFGEEEATEVTVVDANTIHCRTPAGGPGPVEVAVVLFTELRGVLEDGFVYGEPTATPTATELSPPTPTPSPTQDFDVWPEGGDGEIDARDLVEILATVGLSPAEFFEFARNWEPNPTR